MNRFCRIRGFTIVELLVVISIIVLLISLLLPSISKARQVEADMACGGTMRQGLVAAFAYNNDYPKVGLTNYDPRCYYFNQGWNQATTGSHIGQEAYGDHAFSQDWNSPTTIGGGHGPHMWAEGRSESLSWRGYLMRGRYVSYKALGCTAKDYTSAPYNPPIASAAGGFRGSYNDQPSSFFTGYSNETEFPDETNYNALSFRKRPAYVWYGPGGYDPNNIGVYTNGLTVNDVNRPIGGMDTYKVKRLLWVCPNVNTTYDSAQKAYQLPHRPDWYSFVNGGFTGSAYAGNAGFSDGTVRFFVCKQGEALTTYQ